MRQLVLLLLLANGVFFLWEKYVRPGFDAIETQAEKPSKLDSIVLVSELPPVPQVSVSDPLATVSRSDAVSAAPVAPAEVLVAPAPAPVLQETHPKAPTHAPLSETQTDKTAAPAAAPKPAAPLSAKPVAKVEPKPKPEVPDKPLPESAKIPPDQGKPVHRTAEPAKSAAELKSRESSPVTAILPKSDKPAKPQQCRRIGPLASEADAQSLRQRLGTGADKVSLERKASNTEAGYWVLYPPAASLDAARANRRTLMQQGAAAAVILSEGEYALGVSLGFFKERAGAEKMLAESRAKGMAVQIKPRVDRRDEYWLKLQSNSSAAMASTWRAWQAEHPNSPARDSACP